MPSPPSASPALDLTEGRPGAPALWLLQRGELSLDAAGPAPHGMEAREALVRAARFISTRRTCTFERLNVAGPARALSDAEAQGLLFQLRGALAAAAVSSAEASRHPLEAAEVRSAALTVLGHLTATVLRAPAFAARSQEAAREIFALIDDEVGPAARPMLRAHAIAMLQRRGSALPPAERERARALVQGLLRASPPYAELPGPWTFAMCSDPEFHEGECEILEHEHHFVEVPTPADAPRPPAGGAYRTFSAPFATPDGKPIRILARPSELGDENHEMGEPAFQGLLINRHAQLGSFDLVATATTVVQRGYKLMLNSQCAGLTTRFALSRAFPDADIYSSFDSTQFMKDASGKVTESEGNDCFVAILEGMSHKETHAQIGGRIRHAQWDHAQSAPAGFTQFVGPSDPLLVARFDDVNRDGKADDYDGFLDFELKKIAERVRGSATPRDPGCAPSQVSGAAAEGLDWAAGSLDRVTRYSEFWKGLPGEAAEKYTFVAGGFYSHQEAAPDIAVGDGPKQALERLPALCRYQRASAELSCEVMLHSYLSHSGKELKRMLCAAEAWWRAIDLGYLKKTGPLATPLGRRGALLIMLDGLLDFPTDRNFLDGLWSIALTILNLPPLSRSLVDSCITEQDHDEDHYYGSSRGLAVLVGDGHQDLGLVGRADPAAQRLLASDDPLVGRAGEMIFKKH
jgi:hypothetical protein